MTAKVTYFGEEDGPEQVSLFGKVFTVGKAVEVDDDTAIRLMGNPHFKIANPPEVERPTPVVVTETKPAPPAAPLPPAKDGDKK